MQIQQKIITVPGTHDGKHRLPYEESIECPDCYSSLTSHYDRHDGPRYLCENCDQEIGVNEINTDWDDYLNDFIDDNIGTTFTV